MTASGGLAGVAGGVMHPPDAPPESFEKGAKIGILRAPNLYLISGSSTNLAPLQCFGALASITEQS